MAKLGVTIASGTGSFLLVRRMELAQLRLSETFYSNEVTEPNHNHVRPYFEIILKGAYTDQDKRTTLEHRARSVAFQPIVASHSSHIHPEGLHSLKIEMTLERLECISDSLDHEAIQCLNTTANFARGMLPLLGARLYNEWQSMDAVSSLAIEGIVLEMIAESIRCRSLLQEHSPRRWLKEAEDLLHAEFAQPLTLEYIAQTVGVHPVYLARVFRQQRGRTVGDYVRQLRIEYACSELAASNAPLGEIALAAGFADQSHFSKMFKRHVGLSPATYRNCYSGVSRIGKTQVHPETHGLDQTRQRRST